MLMLAYLVLSTPDPATVASMRLSIGLDAVTLSRGKNAVGRSSLISGAAITLPLERQCTYCISLSPAAGCSKRSFSRAGPETRAHFVGYVIVSFESRTAKAKRSSSSLVLRVQLVVQLVRKSFSCST